MKKIIFALLILSFKTNSSPVEVSANVYNEYLQIVETIRILDETKKQLEESYKQVKNFSGYNNYIESELEKKLKNWNPTGDDLTDPKGNSQYTKEFKKIEEELQLYDLEDRFNIDDVDDPNEDDYAKYKAKDKLNKETIAAAAFGKIVIEQAPLHNSVIKNYVDLVGSAKTTKETTDIQSHIIAQSVYNQIEINKTLAMLLKLESAKGSINITQDKWLYDFVKDK